MDKYYELYSRDNKEKYGEFKDIPSAIDKAEKLKEDNVCKIFELRVVIKKIA